MKEIMEVDPEDNSTINKLQKIDNLADVKNVSDTNYKSSTENKSEIINDTDLNPELAVISTNGVAKNYDSPITDNEVKSKKRRRSSALMALIKDSADRTSRYGRPRKPKHDSEDFLPTDAVLGKSPPKSPKKFMNKKGHDSPSSIKPKFLNDDKDENVSLQEHAKDMEPVIAADKSSANSSLNDSLVEGDSIEQEISTEFEPGDLIWGRLGHHPFWPCIIMNDPVDHVYFKTSGHARLSYHVLFYGDNGKRSWVASSMTLRFLGLQDFESQVAAISSEMKKKDPKWFSGFIVKPNVKPRWEAAVREAEEVMPMTRDERQDAFVNSMPQKKGKRPKLNDTDANDTTLEGEDITSPISQKKKIKRQSKVESPPMEKKRGRPRKIDISLSKDEQESEEPLAKSTPGHPRKRKLLKDGPHSKQTSNGEANDDPDWSASAVKRKKMKKKEKASHEDRAFDLFSEKHLERVLDEHTDMNEDDARKYLRILWDEKNEEEKSEYIELIPFEDAHEEESSSEEDENGHDETGIVEDVDSADSRKETNQGESSAVVTKRKINLFRGYRFERVCQVCEKAGNTVRCRGPCMGVFHVECARGADNSIGQIFLSDENDEKPKKRGRKKKLDTVEMKKEPCRSSKAARQKKIYAVEESDSDLDYADGEPMMDVSDKDAVLKMILGETADIPEVSVLTQEESEDDEENSEELENEVGFSVPNSFSSSDFRCGDCAVLRTPLCHACGQATDPSGEDSTRIRCSVVHCGKHYHLECLKVLWPQASYSSLKGIIQNLTCPQHVCHTCVSDNPRDIKGRVYHEKLVRCIRCPTSYHYGNYCVPAGSEILTATQIICPRHSDRSKKGTHYINASWCFICSIGGSLICCDLCPSSFHVDCLKIKPPSDGYICEDCETGRYPLYNEVLWVKLGAYRWWPAVSLFPSEVPDTVKSKPHKFGEFAVRFLGTKDHYWIDRGRCFVYHEGDCVQDGKKSSKSHMENSYQQGVLEASEMHKTHKELRSQLQSQSKPTVKKPPQYVKIKTNKPVGDVKVLEFDNSNISPCECDPNSAHPCSPDVECLNRLLMVECDPNTCPAGERCENQYFEKRVYPALEPYYTDGRDWGLKTLEDLKKGSFVIEYVGEVIDDDEYQRRLLVKHEEKDENYYFLTIDSNRIIDAGPKGNVSRFMNHSCQPNCETQKWTVAGDTRIGLFAISDIPAGTELTFNYNLESKGNEKKPCMCGASNCSGFIGAKKNKVPLSDVQELPSSGKKKRRKPRVRNLIEDICLLCDTGKEVGELISCHNKDCSSRYHLTCIGLASTPRGKWLCARHRCNVCEKRSHQWCSYCTESYCPTHIADNLVNDPLHGDICEVHQKNPLDKEHQKKKQEEKRKLKDEERRKIEEEKKKHDEEERSKRRSRRGQISSEEEGVKEKIDLEGAASENLSQGIKSEDGHLEDVQEASVEDKSFTDVAKLSGKEEAISSKGIKVKNHASPKVKEESPLAVKRGRKKKSLNGENSKGKINIDESKLSKSSNAESNVSKSEDDFLRSAEVDELPEDEIPDADPSLDKFIVQTPASMDDDLDQSFQQNFSSPEAKTTILSNVSPSSVSKRRRKPPTHNKDYVNRFNQKKSLKYASPVKPLKVSPLSTKYSKRPREMNFDKSGLSDELQDIASGFASDDSVEGMKIPPKKMKTYGKSKEVGPSTAKSLNGSNVNNESFGVSGKEKSLQLSSPPRIKSPLGVKRVLSPLISDKSLKPPPSQIFAMQRAKGLKVKPPSSRFPPSNEGAVGTQVERSGKGLKVHKGRRSSAEAVAELKKTENLPGEAQQPGFLKKIRPVLSKVEDNGVSLEEDPEEKFLESNASPLPKSSHPHPMQSPPIKKNRSLSPKKQSPSIGVSSLWNQDINSIMM